MRATHSRPVPAIQLDQSHESDETQEKLALVTPSFDKPAKAIPNPKE